MSRDIENTIAEKIVAFIEKQKETALDDQIEIRPLATCVSIRLFNMPAMKIVYGRDKKFVSINPRLREALDGSTLIKTEKTKSDPWIRVLFNFQDELEQIHPLFLKIYDEAYLKFSAECFGCCSRYEKCSDMKRCIHPDKLIARGCEYRSHLVDGRIFYGKNRNI
jgi:hypothetical protein